MCSIGDLNSLPNSVRNQQLFVKQTTKNNEKMVLTLALNYGAKEEIIEAVKAISNKVKNSIISPEKVDESTIISHLYTRNLPPVDLLIRTSGEERISNFLLWHIAYAELYFTKTLWPDFKKEDLEKALINYKKENGDLERRANKSYNHSAENLVNWSTFLWKLFYAQTSGFVKGKTYKLDSISVSGIKLLTSKQ